MTAARPTSEPDDLELRYYLGVLWRRKATFVLTVALIVAAVILSAQRQPPLYRSTAEVLLQGRLSEHLFAPEDGSNRGQTDSRGRLDTEVTVMGSQSVREAVEKAVGRPVGVSIEPIGQADVVGITATSTDPEEAARIAQTYAETYIAIRRDQLVRDLLAGIETVQAEVSALDTELANLDRPLHDLDAQILATTDQAQRSQLQAQREQLLQQREGPLSRRLTFQEELDQLRLASNLTQTGGAQIISNASVPESPFRPQTRRYTSMAVAVGLVLGLVAAFAREHFDAKVRGKQDLERAVGSVPVLGLIPRVRRLRHRKQPMLVSRTAPQSPAAEAYRRLRTSLQVLGLGQQHQVVQIASPSPHDGRTTTVANLGLSLARAGCRVVLVDANLRRPRLHSFFGLDNEVGLSSLLLRDASLAAALVSVPGEPRLSLLPSGPSPIDPAELLSTSHAQQLFSSISAEADFVLVDGPPLLPVTDAIVLAGLVDAVLLVVRANRTPRADLLHSLELLEQVRAPLVGTALNVTNARRDRGFTYRHGPYLRRQHRRRVPVFLRRGAGKGERAGEPARQA